TGGDALGGAGPPGSVFPAFRRAVRVEGGGGDVQRGPEAELVRRGEEQDVVHQPVREGEGGDADPACLVDGQVRLEVDHLVVGGRGHRRGPGPAAVVGGGHHDVGVRRSGLVGGVGGVERIAVGGGGDRRGGLAGHDAAGEADHGCP